MEECPFLFLDHGLWKEQLLVFVFVFRDMSRSRA